LQNTLRMDQLIKKNKIIRKQFNERLCMNMIFMDIKLK
jgi:hypothetical protein